MELMIYVVALIFITSTPNTRAVTTTQRIELTSPPSESCPADSIIIDGICKCNQDSCIKPPCLSVLNLAEEGTDVPGSCCPKYTCDNCSEEAKIDEKCPCAVGAVLNEAGQCKCVDEYKTITDNECVCNESKCELPERCDDKSVAVKKLEGCCHKTKCIQCPEDSFSTSYNNDQVEDKCACFPCKESECGENQTPVIIRPGSGFPGKCCNLYKCTPANNQGCVINGTTFSEGDTWETSGKILCKCQKGISLCKRLNEEDVFSRSCLADGKVYNHLETWVEDIHNCTNCTCIDGKAKCISHMCLVNQSEIKRTDCQPLANCNKSCPNGFKLNRRGCEICKCNIGPKNNPLDELLREFNITRDDLLHILSMWKRDRITTTTPSTTVNPKENSLRVLLQEFNVSEQELLQILLNRHDTTTAVHIPASKGNEENLLSPSNIALAVVSIIIGVGLAAMSYLLYQQCKKNGLIRYKYKPVKKEKNENNNIAKIYS